MRSKNFWEDRYETEFLPWDTGTPDKHLVSKINEMGIKPCKAIEIGSGTGTNSIWLAAQGFEVLGIDISEKAIEKATEKRGVEGSGCRFMVLDFLKEPVRDDTFDFVFDRGCFHTFETEEDRLLFANRVALHLNEGGLWLSIVGRNQIGCEHMEGPPRRSKSEIVDAVKHAFEIISIETSFFENTHKQPAANWVCVMKKLPCD